MATVRLAHEPAIPVSSPTMRDMKPGQLAIVTDKATVCREHLGDIVLCGTEGRVMCLHDPESYWTYSSVEVRILPAGTQVTLTQEKE